MWQGKKLAMGCEIVIGEIYICMCTSDTYSYKKFV